MYLVFHSHLGFWQPFLLMHIGEIYRLYIFLIKCHPIIPVYLRIFIKTPLGRLS